MNCISISGLHNDFSDEKTTDMKVVSKFIFNDIVNYDIFICTLVAVSQLFEVTSFSQFFVVFVYHT